jgi:4-hydroxy-tetrahydrodipicolinate synthase
VAGVVVCGTTGEAAALSLDEQQAVLATVVAAVANEARASGRPALRIVMGVSGVTPGEVTATLAAFHARCQANDLTGSAGLTAFLVPPPYYVRPSQQGVIDFFTSVADASPLPLLLYDIPARTGVAISTSAMLALADHPRIVGVKDCGGDADHTQAVIADGRLQLLAGDDGRLFSTLCLGGVGAIAASAHLRPELFVRLHALIDTGDLPAARRLWQALWPLTQALFSEPNPAPVKAALAHTLSLGRGLRAPMTAATPACEARLVATLQALVAALPGR